MTDEQRAKMNAALADRKETLSNLPSREASLAESGSAPQQRGLNPQMAAMQQKTVDALKAGKEQDVHKDNFGR